MVILNTLELLGQFRNVLRAEEITEELDILDYAVLDIQPGVDRSHVEVLTPLGS